MDTVTSCFFLPVSSFLSFQSRTQIIKAHSLRSIFPLSVPYCSLYSSITCLYTTVLSSTVPRLLANMIWWRILSARTLLYLVKVSAHLRSTKVKPLHTISKREAWADLTFSMLMNHIECTKFVVFVEVKGDMHFIDVILWKLVKHNIGYRIFFFCWENNYDTHILTSVKQNWYVYPWQTSYLVCLCHCTVCQSPIVFAIY